MRDWDLFKVIIIASLVLALPAGGWIYWQDGEIDKARAALLRAEKSDGVLFDIGQLQEEYERFKESVGGQTGTNVSSLVTNPLDFLFGSSINYTKDISDPRTVERVGGTEIQEVNMKITPLKDHRVQSRQRLFEALYLIERGLPTIEAARSGRVGSPIWKLQSLDIRNEEVKPRGNEAPPDELSDQKWEIRGMVFRRRQREQGGS